jgi:hypothetical protein
MPYAVVIHTRTDGLHLMLTQLFVLVFPTGNGNAISERGFAAMGAAHFHSKQRHEMGHEQVFANIII